MNEPQAPISRINILFVVLVACFIAWVGYQMRHAEAGQQQMDAAAERYFEQHPSFLLLWPNVKHVSYGIRHKTNAISQ
jgi:succinate dehydrogenase/fumarate reductase cytochrome b subunit